MATTEQARKMQAILNDALIDLMVSATETADNQLSMALLLQGVSATLCIGAHRLESQIYEMDNHGKPASVVTMLLMALMALRSVADQTPRAIDDLHELATQDALAMQKAGILDALWKVPDDPLLPMKRPRRRSGIPF